MHSRRANRKARGKGKEEMGVSLGRELGRMVVPSESLHQPGVSFAKGNTGSMNVPITLIRKDRKAKSSTGAP